MSYMKPKPILDVNLKTLRKLSRDLAHQVEQSGYRPDHIVYVERAGLLIGVELAMFFNCSISSIRSSRSGNSMKSMFKHVLRILPRFVTHFLRRLEIGSSLHDIKTDRYISCDKGLPPQGKKILLVDDAIDTGHSLEAVRAFLLEKGFSPEMMKTAVLTTTGENPVIRADYSLYDQVVCAFPWSYDSRQYDEIQVKMTCVLNTIGDSLEAAALC